MADDLSFPLRAASGRSQLRADPNDGGLPAASDPRWRHDARLFAVTFSGAFVFFLALLG